MVGCGRLLKPFKNMHPSIRPSIHHRMKPAHSKAVTQSWARTLLGPTLHNPKDLTFPGFRAAASTCSSSTLLRPTRGPTPDSLMARAFKDKLLPVLRSSRARSSVAVSPRHHQRTASAVWVFASAHSCPWRLQLWLHQNSVASATFHANEDNDFPASTRKPKNSCPAHYLIFNEQSAASHFSAAQSRTSVVDQFSVRQAPSMECVVGAPCLRARRRKYSAS